MSDRSEKEKLRKRIIEIRDHFEVESISGFNRHINRQLLNLLASRQVRVLHSYIPIRSEVDIRPAIRHALESGIQVIVPKTLKKGELKHLVLEDLQDLVTGLFGTHHPREEREFSGEIDMIFVPGVAFDRTGGRLGYGGGYYDQFLANQKAAMKVGICFPMQIVDVVPTEKTDIKVDRLITGQ